MGEHQKLRKLKPFHPSRRVMLAELPIPLTTPPMEARLVNQLPTDPGWQFEPKWDGFRCVAFRAGDQVELKAKSGKTLSRYFPEMVRAFSSLPPRYFVVDGELTIPIANTFSFDALQARLHPAESRVRRLSVETPAIFLLFDILMNPRKTDLTRRPLIERRAALEAFYAALPNPSALRLTPYTRNYLEAQRWLERAVGAMDGIIAKRLDSVYEPGQRTMLKVKPVRTADCVVGGFRYASAGGQVGSLLLGLYNERGLLDHVGFTSGIADVDRPALTVRLEALRSPPGFTGSAPGGPSRWSTERSAAWVPLRPELVVEVRYDQVTGNRFRHGTRLMRWRPDKAPSQCTFDQIEPPRENFLL